MMPRATGARRTSTRNPDADARVARLREEIMSDLTRLRRSWSDRSRWAHRATGDLTARASRLRSLPSWAVGAVAGLLAGVWSVLRRPRKTE